MGTGQQCTDTCRRPLSTLHTAAARTKQGDWEATSKGAERQHDVAAGLCAWGNHSACAVQGRGEVRATQRVMHACGNSAAQQQHSRVKLTGGGRRPAQLGKVSHGQVTKCCEGVPLPAPSPPHPACRNGCPMHLPRPTPYPSGSAGKTPPTQRSWPRCRRAPPSCLQVERQRRGAKRGVMQRPACEAVKGNCRNIMVCCTVHKPPCHAPHWLRTYAAVCVACQLVIRSLARQLGGHEQQAHGQLGGSQRDQHQQQRQAHATHLEAEGEAWRGAT